MERANVEVGYQGFPSLPYQIEPHTSCNLKTNKAGDTDGEGVAATFSPSLKVVEQSNVTSVTFLKYYTCDTMGCGFSLSNKAKKFFQKTCS